VKVVEIGDGKFYGMLAMNAVWNIQAKATSFIQKLQRQSVTEYSIHQQTFADRG
jgi:hypothetical protein